MVASVERWLPWCVHPYTKILYFDQRSRYFSADVILPKISQNVLRTGVPKNSNRLPEALVVSVRLRIAMELILDLADWCANS